MGPGRAAAAGPAGAAGRRSLSPVTVAVGLAVLGLGAAGAGVLTLRFPRPRAPNADEARPSAAGVVMRPKPALKTAMPEVVMPPFGQADEAQRYRDAKAAGSRRAVEVLDQAIAEASQDPRAGAEYLVALRRRRDVLVSPTVPGPEATSPQDEAPDDPTREGRANR